MAFNATGGDSGEFHYLVDICLDSTTLRYADQDLSLQMGTLTGAFYEGRLPKSGTLVRDLGTFLEAREQLNTFALQIDNKDQSLSTLLWNATYANRPVKVWLGEGENLSDYSLLYAGLIEFPGGVEFDDQTATISLVDRRVKDRRLLPSTANKFTTERYPYLETRARTQSIPIVFGDWSSLAASGLSIPCVCINTTIPKFQIACHGISSIDRYLKNAAVVSPSNIRNKSLSLSTFELSGVTYDATSDIMSVNCHGLYTANGTCMETPAAVLRGLQTNFLALTTTDLDVTAYHTVEGHTSTVQVRRYIDTETESDTLMTELLNEAQIDMRFIGGKYSPKYRYLDAGVNRMAIKIEDIALVGEDQEAADFAVRFDPDRMYCNKIPAKWQYDPIDAKFLSATTMSSTFAIVRDQNTVERAMDFYWMWDKAQVESRIARELVLFGVEPAFVEAKLSKRVALQDLADQIDITYSVFSGATFQIRRVETDLGEKTVRVSAYNIFNDSWGEFVSDTAPVWGAATQAQRREQGFWCNASGLAESGDLNSDMSKWY